MSFSFAWELPAAVIGAAAVMIAAFAGVCAIVRAHHGPSHAELAVLGVLVVLGFCGWNTREALAQRFFPDVSGVLEERFASQILNYGDCAAFAARTGHAKVEGSACSVRVLSVRGRYVAPAPPRKSFESPCDLTPHPEVRIWTFEAGSLRDWCAR